jgi:hypothetical protein
VVFGMTTLIDKIFACLVTSSYLMELGMIRMVLAEMDAQPTLPLMYLPHGSSFVSYCFTQCGYTVQCGNS